MRVRKDALLRAHLRRGVRDRVLRGLAGLRERNPPAHGCRERIHGTCHEILEDPSFGLSRRHDHVRAARSQPGTARFRHPSQDLHRGRTLQLVRGYLPDTQPEMGDRRSRLGHAGRPVLGCHHLPEGALYGRKRGRRLRGNKVVWHAQVVFFASVPDGVQHPRGANGAADVCVLLDHVQGHIHGYHHHSSTSSDHAGVLVPLVFP
mmetsp:Transcript_8808/g.54123  ORF Transcript_8808/g.54123 Transcript_8808/m.54123 type:complete len:205 (-) Transcript_8808:1731-2345(-)